MRAVAMMRPVPWDVVAAVEGVVDDMNVITRVSRKGCAKVKPVRARRGGIPARRALRWWKRRRRISDAEDLCGTVKLSVSMRPGYSLLGEGGRLVG